MRAKLGNVGKQLSMFVKDGLTRVHLGPYASQHEARNSADSLKDKLGFKPLLNLR
ncbi:MAG: SPOR domain-containing protein [Gallionella sp.]|nr:SPOR domain-containing protein [Gallionella sp.]